MQINTVNATPTSAPAPTDGQAIPSSRFWPDIEPSHFRAAMRYDGTVTAARLRHALVEAIAAVNGELAGWRVVKIAGGALRLVDIEAEQIDGESALVQRWRRAVYAIAAADLAERYRSFDATGAARQRADDLDDTADQLRADARAAIRALMSVGRCTVELI
ncbi:head completion/stabilization protein [Chromobacterium sp. IIBBL 290-4]|uniref:head completion/stabilization protein n=1 Tax=Chromobacterium sp. IIBBL 290-4 TaxID=2953890 RepID=UPI0020B83620|nr:head completion/stabilization protein [Chromobacterium sp. IIBBL 290-4]UTH73355.1 head completion/stabilization protein [Chromobacterium sp. IIBBL 290-4]